MPHSYRPHKHRFSRDHHPCHRDVYEGNNRETEVPGVTWMSKNGVEKTDLSRTNNGWYCPSPYLPRTTSRSHPRLTRCPRNGLSRQHPTQKKRSWGLYFPEEGDRTKDRTSFTTGALEAYLKMGYPHCPTTFPVVGNSSISEPKLRAET